MRTINVLITLIICGLIGFFAIYILMFAGAASMILAGGVGFGNIIAIVLSWMRNHSISWAVLHFLLGWWYIVYRAVGAIFA
ncbi:MAG: hypothetical protein LBN08_01685 [Lactobacillales bacterium]|jgi:hypothetical protein|nr:hypothetical protein [Lactobacillales bacterium]